MLHRSKLARILAFAIPTFALILAIGAGGAQDQATQALFAPVLDVFQDVQHYYYRPTDVDSMDALYGAMRGVVQSLGDPYSEFLDPEGYTSFVESLEGEFSGVGIEITLVDEILTAITPLVGTPAEAAGMLAGDIILLIDGESTEGISLSEAAVRIRGEIGTTVVLTVRHEDGEIEDISIVRDTIVINPVVSELKAEGTIGYIRILRFEPDTPEEVAAALNSFDLESITGLILDLRNNAGGYTDEALAVAHMFVDEGIVLRIDSRTQGERSFYTRSNSVPNLPLAILINRGTASAAEILTGAIRDNQMGILIGEKTFGKGVFQSVLRYNDGSALKITSGEYFTPNGNVVNGVGILPDIEVPDEGDPIEEAIVWLQANADTPIPLNLGPSPTPPVEAETP